MNCRLTLNSKTNIFDEVRTHQLSHLISNLINYFSTIEIIAETTSNSIIAQLVSTDKNQYTTALINNTFIETYNITNKCALQRYINLSNDIQKIPAVKTFTPEKLVIPILQKLRF
jgi:hypothetical protein